MLIQQYLPSCPITETYVSCSTRYLTQRPTSDRIYVTRVTRQCDILIKASLCNMIIPVQSEYIAAQSLWLASGCSTIYLIVSSIVGFSTPAARLCVSVEREIAIYQVIIPVCNSIRLQLSTAPTKCANSACQHQANGNCILFCAFGIWDMISRRSWISSIPLRMLPLSVSIIDWYLVSRSAFSLSILKNR